MTAGAERHLAAWGRAENTVPHSRSPPSISTTRCGSEARQMPCAGIGACAYFQTPARLCGRCRTHGTALMWLCCTGGKHAPPDMATPIMATPIANVRPIDLWLKAGGTQDAQRVATVVWVAVQYGRG